MLIHPKGSPLLHFSALCDFFERKKFKNYKFFFQKNFFRFLSLRYGADFRRSRLVLLILPKLQFISSPFMHFVQLWWLSHVVGPGFEPGLVLEFFSVSQPVGRGFEPLLRHTFFAIACRGKYPGA